MQRLMIAMSAPASGGGPCPERTAQSRNEPLHVSPAPDQCDASRSTSLMSWKHNADEMTSMSGRSKPAVTAIVLRSDLLPGTDYMRVANPTSARAVDERGPLT